MALLLVVGQPADEARVPPKLRRAGESHRARWQLPQPPWLLERLGAAGQAEMRLPEGRLRILARIEAGNRYVDAFAQWTDEEMLLWSCLRHPLDAYSFHIRRAIILRDKPLVSQSSRSAITAASVMLQPTWTLTGSRGTSRTPGSHGSALAIS